MPCATCPILLAKDDTLSLSMPSITDHVEDEARGNSPVQTEDTACVVKDEPITVFEDGVDDEGCVRNDTTKSSTVAEPQVLKLPAILDQNDDNQEVETGCEDLQEDYEQLRIRNIKEKAKMLSEIFNGVNVDDYKHPVTYSPKRKQVQSGKKTKKMIALPRKHLPRRKASKAASERLAPECLSDNDDDIANFSDEEEIMENGKRRKVVIAFKPRTKRHHSVLSEPRVILSADEVTDADLKNVSDIVTEKVYSQSGTTCHQCRQKTLDMKTICRSDKCTGVRGYFCGPCLRNRYGEDARIALKDPNWECPPCKGICNCSICRNRAGATATGILTPIAKRCGYASVKDYLNDHDKYIIKYEDE